MKPKKFNLVSIFSLVIICISLLSNSVVFASENTSSVTNQLDISDCYSDEIIGSSDSTSSINFSNSTKKINALNNLVPNMLVLDWSATENGIYLYFTNVGVDSIDTVAGTISTCSSQAKL